MSTSADLLSAGEARSKILQSFSALESERILVRNSLGRVLAAQQTARIDVPPFGNSAMDGFAVLSGATSAAGADTPVELRVAGGSAAGSPTDVRVENDTCLRIMTGAPLPEGADAVIPFEEVRADDEHVLVFSQVPTGSCVRPRGNDVTASQEVLQSGVELDARHIGLLVAVGIAEIDVYRKPRVALLSTG
ncbi:MAG: molybdopterin molybdenumtransferase MoeA, partial [Chloroflexi bacterium]